MPSRLIFQARDFGGGRGGERSVAEAYCEARRNVCAERAVASERDHMLHNSVMRAVMRPLSVIGGDRVGGVVAAVDLRCNTFHRR